MLRDLFSVHLHIPRTGERVSFLPQPAHHRNAKAFHGEPLERCSDWITWGDLRGILTGGNSAGVGNIGARYRDERLAIIATLPRI